MMSTIGYYPKKKYIQKRKENEGIARERLLLGRNDFMKKR